MWDVVTSELTDYKGNLAFNNDTTNEQNIHSFESTATLSAQKLRCCNFGAILTQS